MGGKCRQVRPVVIVGPTAVGKSALALRLSERFDGDIITADSRQIYRYMDIGTAKPTPAERAALPHYMLDLVEPDETYSAQRYALEAGRVLRRSVAAGRVPMVVGGTGYYIRMLLDAPVIPPVPPDEGLRQTLRAEVEEMGAVALHARLAALDPASAERIHPNNVPRVIRALEIIRYLGTPVPPASAGTEIPALFLGLRMNREDLWARADRRVLEQMDAGLLEETWLLLEMGYGPASPGLQGFGYRQMIAHLEGRYALPEAVAEYQTATHQYIRRQMTWFRQNPRITWLEAAEQPFEQAADLVERWLTTVW